MNLDAPKNLINLSSSAMIVTVTTHGASTISPHCLIIRGGEGSRTLINRYDLFSSKPSGRCRFQSTPPI